MSQMKELKNTSRVDFFSFHIQTRLYGEKGYDAGTYYEKYDKTVGDVGGRDEIFAAYQNEVPDEFKTLLTDKRIMAPLCGLGNLILKTNKQETITINTA